MKNTATIIASMLGGIVIGATLAMLLTPQSGPELRRQIKDFANDELDKAKAAARKAQGKAEEKIEEVRGKAEGK